MNKSFDLGSYIDVKQISNFTEKEYEMFAIILKKASLEDETFIKYKCDMLMNILDVSSEEELSRMLDDVILRPFKYKTKQEIIGFHLFTGYSIDNNEGILTIDINEKFKPLIKYINNLNKQQLII